jgi:hypothetical protein
MILRKRSVPECGRYSVEVEIFGEPKDIERRGKIDSPTQKQVGTRYA